MLKQRLVKVGIYGFIMFFLALSFLPGCARKEIVNIYSNGESIVCFGDSITFGYGANKGEDYPAYLARLVKTEVINSGIDGDTSQEGLKRVDTDVLDRKPFLVIIEFGGNDFLRKVPKEATLENIGKMVDRVQAAGAMAAVVDISAGMLLGDYRAGLYKLARAKGAIYIPSIFKGIITNPNLKSDFIHPNAEGYKVIAGRVYKAILPYLKKRGQNYFSGAVKAMEK